MQSERQYAAKEFRLNVKHPRCDGRGLMKGKNQTVTEYISIRRDCAAKIETHDETKRTLRSARKIRHVQPISGSKYCDVWQAASYLHVSIATVRKMLSTKRLTRYRVGTRVLILVAELEALVVKDTSAEGGVDA